MTNIRHWPTLAVLAAALALPHFTRGTQTEFATAVGDALGSVAQREGACSG